MIRDDELLRARIHEALDGVQRPAPGLLRRCVAAAEHSSRAPRLRTVAIAAALAAVAAAVVVLTLLQHSLSHGTPGPVQSPTPAPQQVLYTVDAGNDVVALDAQSMRVLWRRSAGGAAPAAVTATGLLKLSADERTLWVLPISDPRGGTALRAFDARTGTPGVTIALSGGAVYSTFAVDPRSGDIAAVGQDGTRILVSLVDPRRAQVLSTTATRQLPPRAPLGSDLALDAVFTADGSRLYYSYGFANADRSGVDWADVSGAQLQPCRAQAAGAACAPGVGVGLALAGTTVVASDTGNPAQLVTLGPDGAVRRRVATGLVGDAEGGVVVSRDGTTATVLGACPNGGGVVRVDLAGGTAQPVATPVSGAAAAPETPCGVRATLLADGGIAVSRLDTGFAGANSPGTVAVVDATGRILRQATLPAGVVDLAATP